ncbi:putative amidoligase domain-containing protein [Cohnella hashimotonis]|uniref:Phage phiEco32-like COOH-NH2 ligase-type 2 n=1 Tax=Cohnella hashimotonis TaxID=2826895 RepID=A0ABT6TFK6_9BACL|nr:hypothetical protein [Cohnella hashimotonis]
MRISGLKRGMDEARDVGIVESGTDKASSKSQMALGTVWIDGKGAVGEMLAAAGLKRLAVDSRPGPSDVIVRLSAGGADPARTDAVAATGHAGAWTWNEAAGAVGSLEPAELDRRLAREGLTATIRSGAAAAGRTGWRRSEGATGVLRVPAQTYVVTVFGLSAPIVRPEPGAHASGRELARRLGRASARAIYSLGLELGTVTWQVDGSGRRGTIVGLDAAIGEPDEAGALRLTEAAAEFAAQWSEEAAGSRPEALLGADPEFVMLTEAGRIVPASRYFGPGERTGSDSVVLRGVQRWPLAELRPRPARDPAVLTQRIRRLLLDASARTAGAKLRWRAGAAPVKGLPLGGHLHFSGLALTAERLRALDNALALPLRLLEPDGAGRRRPRYGALGDFRTKSHGGFEYRTPPSWLVSPRLTLGVLSLAKLAAEHARELSGSRPLDDDALRDAYYDGNLAPLRRAAAAVRVALESLPAYARYGEAVGFLFDAIEAGKVWDESVDIRRGWRIPE